VTVFNQKYYLGIISVIADILATSRAKSKLLKSEVILLCRASYPLVSYPSDIMVVRMRPHDIIRPRLSRGLATPVSLCVKDCTSIIPPYPLLLKTLDTVRHVLSKRTKLTLTEKILYAHLRNPKDSLGGAGKVRGERYLKLRPDRVAMQVSRSWLKVNMRNGTGESSLIFRTIPRTG